MLSALRPSGGPSIQVKLQQALHFLYPSTSPNEATSPTLDPVIRGEVTLSLPKRKELRELVVRLVGICEMQIDGHGWEQSETLRREVILERKLDGDADDAHMLEKGIHKFEFSIVVPTDTAPHERCSHGRVYHKVIAKAKLSPAPSSTQQPSPGIDAIPEGAFDRSTPELVTSPSTSIETSDMTGTTNSPPAFTPPSIESPTRAAFPFGNRRENVDSSPRSSSPVQSSSSTGLQPTIQDSQPIGSALSPLPSLPDPTSFFSRGRRPLEPSPLSSRSPSPSPSQSPANSRPTSRSSSRSRSTSAKPSSSSKPGGGGGKHKTSSLFSNLALNLGVLDIRDEVFLELAVCPFGPGALRAAEGESDSEGLLGVVRIGGGAGTAGWLDGGEGGLDWLITGREEGLGPFTLHITSPYLIVAGLIHLSLELHDPGSSTSGASANDRSRDPIMSTLQTSSDLPPSPSSSHPSPPIANDSFRPEIKINSVTLSVNQNLALQSLKSPTTRSNLPPSKRQIFKLISSSLPTPTSKHSSRQIHPVLPSGSLRAGEPWKLKHLGRLPNDDVLRASSVAGTKTPIRFSHTLEIEVAFQVRREEGGSFDEEKVLRGSKNVGVTGCVIMLDALLLPAYSPLDPKPALLPCHPSSASPWTEMSCNCALQMDELVKMFEGTKWWEGNGREGTRGLSVGGIGGSGADPDDGEEGDEERGRGRGRK